jgi:hypothetical protein
MWGWAQVQDEPGVKVHEKALRLLGLKEEKTGWKG